MLICPKCGYELKHMTIRGNNSIYHCLKCLSTWKAQKSEETTTLKQYFFG